LRWKRCGYEVSIARAYLSLNISTADMEVADNLHIPVNAPVAEIRKNVNSSDGTVIYLGEATCRGGYIHLEMSLKP